MKQICDIFGECSSYVKDWLTKQPEVKEESLTDWFLFNLSEKLPNINYKQFSRTEEGRKTGADWEWWFVFSNTESFACRVQAKKLRLDKDNYPGIAYTNNGKLQIDRLIEDSETDGFCSFYAFYSNESSSNALCGGRLNYDGVFWGEANKLKSEFIDHGRKKLTPSHVLNHTNPISCLFCCPQSGFDKLRFKNYLERYFPSYTTINNPNLANTDQPLGFRPTPKYILQMLSEEQLPNRWEEEYRFRFEKTNAVIVIDLRNKNIR